MDYKHLFSNNIKILRKHRGLTQKDMSDVVGLKSSSSYGDFERGISEPHINYIVKISKVLKVSIPDLLKLDFSGIDIDEYFEMKSKKIESIEALKTLLFSKEQTIEAQKKLIKALEKQLEDS